MGTTNTTTGSNTSTLNFNPAAQSAYNQFIGSGSSNLLGFMNNPFGNATYQMGAGQSQKGAQQAGQNNINALLQSMTTQGLGGQAGQGWLAAQGAQTGRANQAISSQANISNVMAALQRQMQATGMGLSFSPQLTGQSGNFNQTQSTSGLGTWLPQLLGAGLSAFTGGMTGGSMPFGSVGGQSNPGLGTPSYMPGGTASAIGNIIPPSMMGPGMGPSLSNYPIPAYGGS